MSKRPDASDFSTPPEENKELPDLSRLSLERPPTDSQSSLDFLPGTNISMDAARELLISGVVFQQEANQPCRVSREAGMAHFTEFCKEVDLSEFFGGNYNRYMRFDKEEFGKWDDANGAYSKTLGSEFATPVLRRKHWSSLDVT